MKSNAECSLPTVSPDYLCKPEANIFNIDFTRFKIRDLETGTVLFEIAKPSNAGILSPNAIGWVGIRPWVWLPLTLLSSTPRSGGRGGRGGRREWGPGFQCWPLCALPVHPSIFETAYRRSNVSLTCALSIECDIM